MLLAVPKETLEGETRVALVPESVKKLIAAGFAVAVEKGAGEQGHFFDATYAEVGAMVHDSATAVLTDADMIDRPQGR